MDTAKQPSAFLYALKSGLVVSVILIVYCTVLVVTELFGQTVWQWILYLIPGLLCYFFLKTFRNKHLDGYLTFGKAFGICFQITLYAGIICALFILVMKLVLFPAHFVHMLKVAEQKIIDDKRITDEQAEAALKFTRIANGNASILVVLWLINFAFMGTILSLILAAILKKEKARTFTDV